MSDLNELGTCEQILRLIVERGPITAGELAKLLVLTPAAVRRHITTLVSEGYIENYSSTSGVRSRRGRPSRRYVATATGQAQLSEAYSDLAAQALDFLQETLGDAGVSQFVGRRVEMIQQRYSPVVASAGDSPAEKAAALADALDRDGYVTTLRRGGPNGFALQLCQGHCPVQSVAQAFPQLCEAETKAFSQLLGVPIQRLATLAGGEHVCTTNVPIGMPAPLGARRTTSARAGGAHASVN
ncbi:MAG: MarR family transcriptional regulator [Actinomycetaceae bacterium]|nr:MarR family transcriptional regulator [Arcanobacterium sp.]MDD7504409.1 MarR family transcriptional regulator [Actinomycetaceae bacterium]MDY6143597.1 MarR family transcriptional regulator [Arcanobacterium sp.]